MKQVHHIEEITAEQIRRLAALCLVSKQLAKAGFSLDNSDLSFWNEDGKGDINVTFKNNHYVVDDIRTFGKPLLTLTKQELILFLEELALEKEKNDSNYEMIKEGKLFNILSYE